MEKRIGWRELDFRYWLGNVALEQIFTNASFKGVYLVPNIYDAVMKTDGEIYARLLLDQRLCLEIVSVSVLGTDGDF
jgi:hypothetical protein